MVYNKKFLFADILIIISCLCFIGVHVLTNVYVAQQVQVTKADYDAVVTSVESNPIGNWYLKFHGLATVFRYLIIPSIILGFYYVVRKRKDPIQAGYVAVLFCSAGILNVCNDLSMYLGTVLR